MQNAVSPRVTIDAVPYRAPIAWAVTTGEDGMRTQARGLAAACAMQVIEKSVPRLNGLGALRRWLNGPLAGSDFAPPWPDLLVTCGRRSVAVAAAVRRASPGKTLTVHVQDPRGSYDAFDLVVAMAHDRAAPRPHLIKVATALHDLTPAALAEAADAWRPRLKAFGAPLTGVIIGGDLRGRAFTTDDGRRLLGGLRLLRAAAPTALAITPSRRTPPAVRDLLAEAFRDDPSVFLWDMTGDNPYRGILALADRLVVTGDSVSMISEAIATTAAVEVMDLGFPRHIGFMQALVDTGRIRRFDGDSPSPSPAPSVDATRDVADRVRGLLAARADQARTGDSG